MHLASSLRELTFHTGPYSATCYPAEVTFPPPPQPIKAGTRFSDPTSHAMHGKFSSNSTPRDVQFTKQEAFKKMLGPFATAIRRTP